MDVVIFLLPLCEVTAPDGRHNGVYVALTTTIISTKFMTFEMNLGQLRTCAILNKDICGVSRCKGTYLDNRLTSAIATPPLPLSIPHSGKMFLKLHKNCLARVLIVVRRQFGYTSPCFPGILHGKESLCVHNPCLLGIPDGRHQYGYKSTAFLESPS